MNPFDQNPYGSQAGQLGQAFAPMGPAPMAPPVPAPSTGASAAGGIAGGYGANAGSAAGSSMTSGGGSGGLADSLASDMGEGKGEKAGKALSGIGAGMLADARSRNQANFQTIFGHAQEAVSPSRAAPAVASAPQFGVHPSAIGMSQASIGSIPMVQAPQMMPQMSDRRVKTNIQPARSELRAFLDAIGRTRG